MSKRWRRSIIAIVVAGLLGVLALPPVHWRLYGWAKGEPFYRGRPASYWAAELRPIRMAGQFFAHKSWVEYRRVDDPLGWVKSRLGYAPRFQTIEEKDIPFADPDPAAVPVLTALAAGAT